MNTVTLDTQVVKKAYVTIERHPTGEWQIFHVDIAGRQSLVAMNRPLRVRSVAEIQAVGWADSKGLEFQGPVTI
jgi:hypothetical protein